MKNKKIISMLAIILLILIIGVIVFLNKENETLDNKNKTVNTTISNNQEDINNVETDENEENIIDSEILIANETLKNDDYEKANKILEKLYEVVIVASTSNHRLFDSQYDENLKMDELLNYEQVMNALFTENGRILYEKMKSDLVKKEEKYYVNIADGVLGVDYQGTSFKDVKISEESISCIADNIYTDENNKTTHHEKEFVVKKQNGRWKIDIFSSAE